MQSRSSLFFAIVVVLTGLALWGYQKLPYRYGIDVKGGIRFVYSISQTADSKEKGNTLEQDRAATIRIMEARAQEGLGVNEATVQAKGANQIVIELPGFTDRAEARKVIGSTARLKAFHAKNVTTALRPRIYTKSKEETIDGTPVVFFQRTVGDNKPIGPDDPEYAQIIAQWGDPILQGADLADAKPLVNGQQIVPEFTFSREGATKMENWTRSVFNQGEHLAFVIDGRVLSIAPIKDGTILKADAFIDGEFDPKAVETLCKILREGALEVDLKNESDEQVDPSIGQDALDKIVKAGVVSYVIVCLFIIAYYGLPGIVAALALVLYGLYTITALKGLGATFSLAAIAAFVLSVGMAVDANILVFERIKEELRSGRPLLNAVDFGFKRALTAIIDSNACTILTSLVLFVLGTGPVKGFAITLIWGVLISFFTAITVTRALTISAIKMGLLNDPKFFAVKRNWFGEKFEEGADKNPLNIVGRTKRWFAISIVLIVVGLGFVGIGGIKPNVEFSGGYEAVYNLTSNQDLTTIRKALATNGLEKANVKIGSAPGGGRVAYITVPQTESVSDDLDVAKTQIAQAANLAVDEKSTVSNVGPTIRQETVSNAILGIVIATGLIMFYIALRFGVALGGMKNGIKFGVSAIIAMLHDGLFVFGAAGILGYFLGWEVSALFITAMLTVIGFSVHDTIVIFDRIRENLRRQTKGETFTHLVDKSVTQTVARSINTSMTAFVTLLILVFYGTTVPDIRFMCLTMAAGIAVGTYSSIFNASPILWLWNNATVKKHGEQADLMEEALREARLQARIELPVGATGETTPDASGQYGTVKRKQSAERGVQKIDED